MLARYHHLNPRVYKSGDSLAEVTDRLHDYPCQQGQQADYVILVGLQEGNDGFPAPARESIMESALLPQVEDFRTLKSGVVICGVDARARAGLAAFNKDNPSRFVEALKQLDVPVARKP